MTGPAITPAPDSDLFRESFGSSPIGIAVETMEGQPLFVNSALCSMLGFTEAEMQGKHCVDYSPPEDAQKDWALFQQLRAGSIDRYQLEKRYFRRDGTLMWGRLSLSLLSGHVTPCVLAMVEDITEQKRAQDSELGTFETLDLVTKQMAAAVSRCSRDLRYLWVNQAYADWIQRPLNDVVGRPISDVLGKDAFDALLPHFNGVLTGGTVRYEQETNFQGIGRRWTSATYTPTLDGAGVASGWVEVVLDVTERKQAERALAGMTRTLIEAQEKERARIGRELHDDINQRLALLSMEVEQLRANPAEIEPRAEDLRVRIGEISMDVQALAHDLHPSRLEYLGAVAGMKSWAKEFARRHGLDLHITTDVHTPLPLEIGISLFRVLQEALQNAVKHSGAKSVDVQLREDSEALHLVVRDSGRGFDIDAASRRKGLGLTSMRERVRLVSGTIAIDSKPGIGTAIEVRVPVEPAPAPRVKS